MSQKKITKRADGRFKVNYMNKQFYGKTKAEAMQKRDEYIAAETDELHPDLSRLTFADYSTKWLSVYRTECCLSQQKQYAAAEAVRRNDPVYGRAVPSSPDSQHHSDGFAGAL